MECRRLRAGSSCRPLLPYPPPAEWRTPCRPGCRNRSERRGPGQMLRRGGPARRRPRRTRPRLWTCARSRQTRDPIVKMSIRIRASVALAAVISLAVAVTADAAPSQKKAIWGPVRVDGVSQFPIYRDLGVGIYQIELHWNNVASSRPARPTDPSDPAYRWPAV